MKAIITGGTGFIGRHVVAELLNSGVDVTVLTSILPPQTVRTPKTILY